MVDDILYDGADDLVSVVVATAAVVEEVGVHGAHVGVVGRLRERGEEGGVGHGSSPK